MQSDHHGVSASRNAASTSSRIAGSISSSADCKKEGSGTSIRRVYGRILIGFLGIGRANAFVLRRRFAPMATAPENLYSRACLYAPPLEIVAAILSPLWSICRLAFDPNKAERALGVWPVRSISCILR